MTSSNSFISSFLYRSMFIFPFIFSCLFSFILSLFEVCTQLSRSLVCDLHEDSITEHFFYRDLWKVVVFFFNVFLSILGMSKNNLQVGNLIPSQILLLFFLTLFVAFLESFTADIEVLIFFSSGSVIFQSYFIGLYKVHNLVFL